MAARAVGGRKQDVADLQDSLHEAHSKYFYLALTYDRVKDTPAKLSYYTGLVNSDVFDALWSFLSVTEDGIVSVGGKLRRIESVVEEVVVSLVCH